MLNRYNTDVCKTAKLGVTFIFSDLNCANMRKSVHISFCGNAKTVSTERMKVYLVFELLKQTVLRISRGGLKHWPILAICRRQRS